MERLERAVLITELLDRMRDNGSWATAVHLQKGLYFLQEMRGVQLGYEFVVYRHGPFSFELKDELERLRGEGILKWIFRSSPQYSPSLASTPFSKELRGELPNFMAKYDDSLTFVAENIGPMKSKQLERVSTAFYFLTKGVEGDDEVTRMVCDAKPHIPHDEELEAVRYIRKIAEQAGWRPRDGSAVSFVA